MWILLNDVQVKFRKTDQKQGLIEIRIHCFPDVGAEERVSFGSRRPDNVFRYRRDVSGPQSIVLLGDNKGRYAHNYFPDEEIGHILDMGMSLMANYQRNRRFMYCFLTNGYNFQFFKIHRDRDSCFHIEQSLVFCDILGWQVI